MPAGSIWIDITELFDQFRIACHPTGISRTVLSLADALIADPMPAFRDARALFWHPLLGRPLTFIEPPLPLSAFFARLSELYAAAHISRPLRSRAKKALATSMPRSLRYRLFPADNGVVLFSRWARTQGIGLAPANFGAKDCLFIPGSFWLGRYMRQLKRQARKAGLPLTVLVHDVLPLSHPQWLPARHRDQFRRGCETLLPDCAAVVCTSQYTREELRRYVQLPERVTISTFRLADRPAAPPASMLPMPVPADVSEFLHDRYVLFVSTLIARKNHKLLVDAWKLLSAQHGPATPLLLFAGSGRPDAVLARLMERHNAGSRCIVALGSVDEASLEALYRHAWITAYPSLAEGFGLPVAEALSRGKLCLAAPSGGVREIAPDLIDFIDPHDPASVADKVNLYLADPTRLAAREAEIKRRYRATDWADSARMIRTVLDRCEARTASRGPGQGVFERAER